MGEKMPASPDPIEAVKKLWAALFPPDKEGATIWAKAVRLGYLVCIILLTAPHWVETLKPYVNPIQGVGFLIAALTAMVHAVRVIKPITPDAEQWLRSSLVSSWAAAATVGTLYGAGFKVADFSPELENHLGCAPYAIERYGRFVLLSMPIGILSSLLTAGLVTGETANLGMMLLALAFFAVGAAVLAYVSSQISELHLARSATDAFSRQLGFGDGAIVKVGTMDYVFYPLITMILCLAILLALQYLKPGLRTFVVHWCFIIVGLWSLGCVFVWSCWCRCSSSYELIIGGTGLGILSSLILTAIGICASLVGSAKLLERKRRLGRPDRPID
jgi:hypothetical protein